jgi:hypothetical protein
MTERYNNPLGDKYQQYLNAGPNQMSFLGDWLVTRQDPEPCIGKVGNAALTGDEGAVLELQRIYGIQSPETKVDDETGLNASLDCPRRECNGCLKLFIETDEASRQGVAALRVSDCQEQP